MKLVHIVGNRPQFIKLALLYKALASTETENIIVHSGQHFDVNMSDVFFEQLNIPVPDYSLGINNLSHNEMIGKMLVATDPILLATEAACVIVYGDTNTTLAGALAARKRNIPVAHIEAGVRTGDETMPEEVNRYLTDRIATFNFCCTSHNVDNLKREGFFSGTIRSHVYHSGDIMLDASLFFKNIARTKARLPHDINVNRPFVLATIHRTENTEDVDALRNIIAALNNIHQQTKVVFPMHPKTKALVHQHQIPVSFAMPDAIGYLESLALVQSCSAVITDSGGLAREAFFFKKPVVVVMQNPFWPEMFDHGNCLQSGSATSEITAAYRQLLSTEKSFDTSIFGNGDAAEKISNVIVSAL